MSTPFNITSALLAHVMAQGTGRQPDDSIRSFGKAHLLNPMEQARLQLTRESRRLPQLRLNPVGCCLFTFGDREDYDPHSAIRAPVAV